MHFSRTAAALAIVVTMGPAVAGAQLRYVEPIDGTGGGLGAVPTVLTLMSPRNGSSAMGCITPTGRSGCGIPDLRMQHHSQVQSLSSSALDGITGSSLRVVGNFAEPGGGSITVDNLVLTLFNGNVATFTTSNFLSPVTFASTNPGVGNYGFTFALSPSDAALFDSYVSANPDADWSVGLGAVLSDAEGGLDTFSLARAASVPTVTPEPASLLLMATGLAGLFGIVRRTRRMAVAIR